jgi:hypothetical protein
MGLENHDVNWRFDGVVNVTDSNEPPIWCYDPICSSLRAQVQILQASFCQAHRRTGDPFGKKEFENSSFSPFDPFILAQLQVIPLLPPGANMLMCLKGSVPFIA